MDPQQETKSGGAHSSFSIPMAIVVAGVIIAGAILYIGGSNLPKVENAPGPTPGGKDIKVNSVSAADHILGNPNAPVIIVEFSDLECPFCKLYHQTMKRIVEEYAEDGKVAWVYRHFPLDIHPKASKEAEATECAAELGGETAFWKYVDNIFEITPSNNGLDLAKLPEIAQAIGLDQKKFEACLASGKYASKVQAHTEDAIASGAQGTPHSILLVKGGEPVSILGAQPYEQVKQLIEKALKQ